MISRHWTGLAKGEYADQYIEHLRKLTEIPAEELADFLVVAARLLYLKSKMLLPLMHWGEEEEEGDLERRLRMYKEYVEAAKKVQGMLAEKRHTYVREKPPVSALGFAPPKDLTAEKMAELFRDVLRRLVPVVKTPEGVIEKTVSIHEKIQRIHDLIKKHTKLSFHHVLRDASTRAEIIVSFLALLEMVKQKHVTVKQGEHFGEIHLEKV